MRETERGLSIDNALVRLLRRLLRRDGGGSRPIVCGETKYGCDPRSEDDTSDDDDDSVADASSSSFPALEAGVVGELTGLAHLSWLLQEAGSCSVEDPHIYEYF